MLSEDIEAIVDANPELELRSQVADNAANNTENNGRPCGNVTRSRRDSNETLRIKISHPVFQIVKRTFQSPKTGTGNSEIERTAIAPLQNPTALHFRSRR